MENTEIDEKQEMIIMLNLLLKRQKINDSEYRKILDKINSTYR